MSDLYGAAMVAGMATCSPTQIESPTLGFRNRDEWFDVLWNKVLHKDEQRRYEQLTGDDAFYFTSTGFRQFGPTIYNDEGDAGYVVIEYDPSEDGSWHQQDAYTDNEWHAVPNERQVREHLRYHFGDGVPCSCGICNAGGDCCGRWFVQGLDIWSAGDGRWYVKVHSYRNI